MLVIIERAHRIGSATAWRHGIEPELQGDLSPSLLTRFVGLADLCGLSVPMSPAADGLPAGLQFVAATGADESVLAAGMAFQSVTDWHHMRPPAFLDH